MSVDNVTTMLSAARQLEDMYTSQRVEDLDRLASGLVTLHKDSMMLMSDIQGIDNLKKYYQVAYLAASAIVVLATFDAGGANSLHN